MKLGGAGASSTSAGGMTRLPSADPFGWPELSWSVLGSAAAAMTRSGAAPAAVAPAGAAPVSAAGAEPLARQPAQPMPSSGATPAWGADSGASLAGMAALR